MTIQIAVRLPDGLVAQLDELVESKRGPENRSVAVRHALETYLAIERRHAVDRAIVVGYTEHPQSQPDDWGDLAVQQELWARVSARALDEEDGGWS